MNQLQQPQPEQEQTEADQTAKVGATELTSESNTWELAESALMRRIQEAEELLANLDTDDLETIKKINEIGEAEAGRLRDAEATETDRLDMEQILAEIAADKAEDDERWPDDEYDFDPREDDYEDEETEDPLAGDVDAWVNPNETRTKEQEAYDARHMPNPH
ncbi:hypothetical protein KBB17_04360 [Candidatus Saccharibacteria bacterium]|jgi:hypothetical protein|nr:hypothetical protein [Candidatus Saccharibacteria bacterium]MBP9131598.1 hypothetical protein [Candidatus Saccharibacteria bacterium]